MHLDGPNQPRPRRAGRTQTIRRWRAFILIALAVQTQLSADEFPIVVDSTVIGRNYGIPFPSAFDRFDCMSVGDLDFAIDGIVFAKNLELTSYPTDVINGETFFGTLTPMGLIYQAGDATQVELGALLQQDFGTDDFWSTREPLFRLIHEPVAQHYFVVGSLIRTHWIHDALYDDVSAFRDAHETGIQYRIDQEHWKTDAWMDWRIKETANRAEQFEGAVATQ